MSDTDITGRTSAHRNIALRCPGCGASMSALDLEEAKAEVDVCRACGGLWVDWFDGEVRTIATETLRVDTPDLAPETDRRSNDPVAIGACPRCSKQLVPERYGVTIDDRAAREDEVQREEEAQLLRCEDCMGAFVTRASAEVLAWRSGADAPPPSMSVPPTSAKPLPWDRFLRVLKGFLGLDAK
ncbi:MAG: zf-TFIIB domain-containing protein [Labilithrix sp.]|nr:zf-TFIIB domain-containing protein [Labilithrix sp.]MCW5814313.1 zf-TFIIB domain-containing protein [Labilithrix sp.]